MIVKDYIKALENTILQIEGDNCIIRLRKRIANKQPLYIWNMTKMCYVSSLLEVNPKLYKFNILHGEEMTKYKLIVTDEDNVKVERA